jgi:hypothetical protein
MKISALYYYPIKSCKGVSVERIALDARGFAHDRRLMVVDSAYQFLTQREQARMALIEPRLQSETLTLNAPGVSPLTLTLTQASTRVEVVIWRDRCIAIDQGETVSCWLSDFLGESCRLVYFADDVVRQCDQTYALRATDQVGFADGFPLLLTSEASLTDLNRRLDTPLPMNRFRPNLVVSGCEPYAEDTWRHIRINGIVFDVVKPCARCVITTTHQETAERGREPLRTLATYRDWQGKATFGQNVIHTALGCLHVGDEIEVI